MTLSCSFALVRCPSCGEPIMPSGTQIGKEPDLLTLKCPNCRKIISASRNPASVELEVKVAKKN